jgi:hypothetical protein
MIPQAALKAAKKPAASAARNLLSWTR